MTRGKKLLIFAPIIVYLGIFYIFIVGMSGTMNLDTNIYYMTWDNFALFFKMVVAYIHQLINGA